MAWAGVAEMGVEADPGYARNKYIIADAAVTLS